MPTLNLLRSTGVIGITPDNALLVMRQCVRQQQDLMAMELNFLPERSDWNTHMLSSTPHQKSLELCCKSNSPEQIVAFFAAIVLLAREKNCSRVKF